MKLNCKYYHFFLAYPLTIFFPALINHFTPDNITQYRHSRGFNAGWSVAPSVRNTAPPLSAPNEMSGPPQQPSLSGCTSAETTWIQRCQFVCKGICFDGPNFHALAIFTLFWGLTSQIDAFTLSISKMSYCLGRGVLFPYIKQSVPTFLFDCRVINEEL